MSEQRFGQILAVVNPGGRHVKRAGAMIENLREFYGKSRVVVIHSLPNATEYRDVIRNEVTKMGQGTRMAICSGDYGFGNALIAASDKDVKRECGVVGIGALACGTKCDGAKSFLPDTKDWAPYEIFERAQPTPFRTGVCTVTPKHLPPLFTLRYGLYASGISTPNGAAYANSKEIRETDLADWRRDLKIARYTIAHTQQARISWPCSHEAKITESLSDLIVPNITHMAGRRLRNTTIDDTRGMRAFTVPAKMSTAETLMRFWRGILPSDYYPEGFSVAVEDEIRMQCDGETTVTRVADLGLDDRDHYTPEDQIVIPAGSELAFRRSDTECYPLTTLPRAA